LILLLFCYVLISFDSNDLDKYLKFTNSWIHKYYRGDEDDVVGLSGWHKPLCEEMFYRLYDNSCGDTSLVEALQLWCFAHVYQFGNKRIGLKYERRLQLEILTPIQKVDNNNNNNNNNNNGSTPRASNNNSNNNRPLRSILKKPLLVAQEGDKLVTIMPRKKIKNWVKWADNENKPNFVQVQTIPKIGTLKLCRDAKESKPLYTEVDMLRYAFYLRQKASFEALHT
ncbi:hypothetical protein RFI_07455, partial [Reticulomyxa filosa]